MAKMSMIDGIRARAAFARGVNDAKVKKRARVFGTKNKKGEFNSDGFFYSRGFQMASGHLHEGRGFAEAFEMAEEDLEHEQKSWAESFEDGLETDESVTGRTEYEEAIGPEEDPTPEMDYDDEQSDSMEPEEEEDDQTDAMEPEEEAVMGGDDDTDDEDSE